MPKKPGKASKKKVKVGSLSKSKKTLNKSDMKKVKGGSTPHNYSSVKIDF